MIPPSSRQRAFGGLLAALTLGLALAGAELVLRLAAPSYLPLGVPGLAGRAGFIDQPRGFRFAYDREGYRTAELSVTKPAGELRVVLLGDSHAFGLGVDDDRRFSQWIETLATPPAGRTVRVLDLALPGDSWDAYARRADGARRLRPDLYLVVSYSGNDLVEVWVNATQGREVGLPAPPVPWPLRTLRRLHLWHLLRGALSPAPARGPTPLGSGACQASFALDEIGAFTQAVYEPCLLRSEPALAAATTLVADKLRELQATAATAGADLVVAVLPSRLLAEPARASATTAAVTAKLGLDLAAVTAGNQWAQEAEIAAIRAAGLPVIDLREALAGSPEPAFFPRDWHLNETGHRRVGEALARALSERWRIASNLAGGTH